MVTSSRFFRCRQEHGRRPERTAPASELDSLVSRADVVCRLAFLDRPRRSPVRSNPGEAGEATSLMEREPDVVGLGFITLGERVERHRAAVLEYRATSCRA